MSTLFSCKSLTELFTSNPKLDFEIRPCASPHVAYIEGSMTGVLRRNINLRSLSSKFDCEFMDLRGAVAVGNISIQSKTNETIIEFLVLIDK